MTATLEITTATAELELLQLAEKYLNEELDAADVQPVLERLANPKLSPAEAWDAFQDLAAAVERQQDLDNGLIDWTAIDDELTGPGIAETAAEIAEENVNYALKSLLPRSAR